MNTRSRVSTSIPPAGNPNVKGTIISNETISVALMQIMVRNMKAMVMKNMKMMNN